MRSSGSVRIAASGVVLRGEGDGPTVDLEGAGRGQRSLIVIKGPDPDRPAGQGAPILDDYVPVGATSLRVADAARFHPGDSVIVRRAGNAAWIRELGMDRIPPRTDGGAVHQWSPFDLDFERIVTAVDGDRLTLDAPITCAIETRWGGGAVHEFRDQRIRNCAVENLRGVSAFDPAVTALYGRERKNITPTRIMPGASSPSTMPPRRWVRHVTALHFGYACVEVRRARQVTVEDCDCREMVSILTGSRRYAFVLGGQLTLVRAL